MLRVGQSPHTSSHRVHFWSLLVGCVLIGPLGAACANAAGSGLLAQNQSPPRADSLASAAPTTPFNPATSGNPAASGGVKPPQAKHPNYSLHLHGGLFAPIDVNATSPTMGMRLARNVTGHLQAGLMTGWTFRRKNLEQPVPSLPGIKPQLVLARLDGHLVPLMGFLQVNLSDKRYLIPYGGIALGYEWLSLVANDYVNGGQAHSSYANWAWESWGGIGIRLDQKVRFDTELFYNGGSLERDVVDSNGLTLREAIDANGVGARVGVGIQF